MSADEPNEIAEETAAHLAALLLDEETVTSALDKAVTLAVRSIPNCDSCAVSVLERGKLVSAASTDGLAERLDAHQTETDQGPCLEAIRTGQRFDVEDIARDPRFDRYGPRAAAEGLLASYSIPLTARDNVIGALNVYSRSRPFDDLSRQSAEDVGEQAAVLLANVQLVTTLQRLVDELSEAVQSRDVIGQAKGIIMASEKCTADQAFVTLRKLSQGRNVKLRELAARIAETGTTDV